MLSIGKINYLNCLPIFTEFISRYGNDYSIVEGVPSELNSKLRSGSIDISPSSSIEYALYHSNYLLFPDLSISANGAVKSVLLFSRLPIEELDNKDIEVTPDSATSVILLKIILRKYFGFRNRFITSSSPEITSSENNAYLLIGDNAMRAALNPILPYIYDLGALWKSFTTLPFVFALWILNKNAINKGRGEVLKSVERFIEAKAQAQKNYHHIAGSVETFLTNEELEDYWNIISYDLTQEHIEGLKLFFSDALEIKSLESMPEIRFIQ